ncbi:transcription/translation regulatory transformer protein RfaH [Halopseudomonas sabulinigri]|uniref:Transcription antitermination protein RfaH n=1 Tax=Halopseudomonas sabulinigri TaxID=472181 RepID=A0ABP9ZQ33_9GAMM
MSEVTSPAACWYLIQSKPKQDERAELNLRNQGFTCYRPTHKVEVLRRGRRLQLEESLFPGYLFIRLDRMQDNWFAIRSTRGVSRLVCFGQDPARVSAGIIYSIKTLADIEPVSPALHSGDRVRITEGPFSDLEAIFLRPDGDERAILLLNLLHREQKLKVPLRAIKPSSPPRAAPTRAFAGPTYA